MTHFQANATTFPSTISPPLSVYDTFSSFPVVHFGLKITPYTSRVVLYIGARDKEAGL